MQEEAKHVMTLDDVRAPDDEGMFPLTLNISFILVLRQDDPPLPSNSNTASFILYLIPYLISQISYLITIILFTFVCRKHAIASSLTAGQL